MYTIVNYDAWWKYPKTFNDFNTAYMMYELLGDINSSIEFFDFETETRQVVWDKTFERREDGTKAIPCECTNRLQ